MLYGGEFQMKNIFLRNNVNVIGEGTKTIVFGHGFGCDQNIWQFMTPYFQKDHRMILFDYVGSGKSDLKAYNIERYKDLRGYAQDLLEVIEASKSDSIIFIGHSVSAMIGLIASIEKPELFEAVVMIGPSPRYINELPDYFGGFNDNDIKELINLMEVNYVGWASLNAAALMNNPDRPMLAQHLKKIFTQEDPVIMRNFAEATFFSDHRKDLQNATVPTLIVQCSKDSIVPIEVANYLNSNIKNSKLEVIGAKGHYPNLSEPKETSQLIIEYLSSLKVIK